MQVIQIEGEKKVIGIIVGLIFIIIVILAVLISLNERTKSTVGNTKYGGGTVGVTIPEQQDVGTPTGQVITERPRKTVERVTRPVLPVEETEYASEEDSDKQVIVLSPYQIAENYQRARNIILNSQCYYMLGDVREITYYEHLVGQKFIADLAPNADFSEFTAVIAVKLSDARHVPVYYEEYPIVVDLKENHVTECKGRPLTAEDVMQER